MNGKRFTTDNGSHEDVTLVDNLTGVEYESDFDEVLKLMNSIHEENQSLKQSIENLLNSEPYWENKAKQRITELETENMALKEERDFYKGHCESEGLLYD